MLPLRAVAVALALLALATTGAALPFVACAPTCTVVATVAAYAPGVVVVENGGHVAWTALEAKHTMTAPGCFHAEAAPGQPTGARFDVRASGLWVQVDGRDWTHCSSAEPVEGGRYLVVYECLEHAHHMDGRLLVEPPPG